MTALRIALTASGFAAVGYGAILVWDFQLRTLVLIAVWAGVGVIVHDFVFAPFCAAVGWTGRRLIRGRWWPPVAIAGLCSAVLVILAIPVFSTPGARPDNMTVLDRDYPLGLGISLAAVWACVPLYYLVASLISRSQSADIDSDAVDLIVDRPGE